MAGRHNSTLESCPLSLWDCMGFKPLTYRAGTSHSGPMLILQQKFEILQMAHLVQQSQVVLLCFSSVFEEKLLGLITVS